MLYKKDTELIIPKQKEFSLSLLKVAWIDYFLKNGYFPENTKIHIENYMDLPYFFKLNEQEKIGNSAEGFVIEGLSITPHNEELEK